MTPPELFAGGLVDRFYAAQGYETWAVLVQTPAEAPGDLSGPQYAIVGERVEDEIR